MPYSVRWYIPNAVLYVDTWGEMDFDEIQSSTRRIMDIERSVPQYQIQVILNALKSKTHVSPSQGIQLARGIERVPNVGWMVSVAQRGLIESFIVTLVTQLTRVQQVQVATLEDAFRFLKDRVDLDWSQGSFDHPYLIYEDVDAKTE